jgi:hypothetical protein
MFRLKLREGETMKRSQRRIKGAFALWLPVLVFSALFLDAQAPPEMAVIKGNIVFEGALPPPRRIIMSMDPYCAPRAELALRQNPIEDVMVYVSSPLSTKSPTPQTPVVIHHRDCMFAPHVLTIQTGQPLIIRNDDAAVQNLHAWSEINTPFSISQDRQGSENTQHFDKPEPPFVIRDDIFNWKSAYISVFDHPYHTVAKFNATYELKVPGGSYEITAWNERYGKQALPVEVKNGETRTLNFVFKLTDEVKQPQPPIPRER